MGDVKPMHCQIILNRMESTYAGSTIRQTYIAMGTMFKSAVMNDIIAVSYTHLDVYKRQGLRMPQRRW